MKSPRIDRRMLRREVIRDALKQSDSTITAVEQVDDPIPDGESGNWWAEVVLYRVGSGVPPERVAVLVHLETKQVLRKEQTSHTEKEML